MAPSVADDVEIERYCMLVGRLGRLAGDGIEKEPLDGDETSSNLSSTTTFGSVRLRNNDLLKGVWLTKLLVRV